MTMTTTTTGYRVELNPDERAALLTAVELAIAVRRGEPERGALVHAIDSAVLDSLADVLFLGHTPTA